MRTLSFANRNTKELVRDPLTVFFGVGFPIVLLLLLSAIQANIPVELFAIGRLAPGIAVFSLSFISLFSGTLISKDRTDSFLMRLFASPLSSGSYIMGYLIPLIPIALLQSVACLAVAIPLGLEISVNLLVVLAVIIPNSILYISLGLLCGSVFTDKQVGGICGALLTNVSAWLSGIWFDLELVGGVFKRIAEALPFVHAVNAAKYACAGNYSAILPELLWVLGYSAVIMVLAVIAFSRKMKK